MPHRKEKDGSLAGAEGSITKSIKY